MLNQVVERIKSPGTEFRGVPFWSWNAKLDPAELRRQIRVMREMGMGGFFMHSRVGLATVYLGREWFDCVKACIDEAEKQGMNAWLYDEDRWPSGAAGGLVTREEKYRMRELQVSACRPADAAEVLGTFAFRMNGSAIFGVRRLASPEEEVFPGETKAFFSVRINRPESWYNGQTYLDTMNAEAVRRFIDVTHRRYDAEIGETFGTTVRGIFTDEPNYLHSQFSENAGTFESGPGGAPVPFNSSSLPWTGCIPERFREKFGYDLLEHLPELFFELGGEEFSKVRLDFFNLVTELFVNAFSRQLGEWCGEHHLLLTGHVLCEDSLLAQRMRVGAAMRFYEYMQAPGIDLLTEQWRVYDTAIQCSSVAHQFGRRWRLSETYGCTGWDFPFRGHKALGDWQYALGINLRCLHLSWYSMAAEAKRDYPASIFFQSPWYRQYPVVEDYFARLGAALSEGEEARDLLVIHPIESTWGWKHYPNLTEAEREEEDNRLIEIRDHLLRLNLDFDYGDEEILSRHAAVSGARFRVRLAEYRAVLVPRLRTIRRSTLELLRDFRRAGGTVAFCGAAPERVDGVVTPEAEEAFRNFTFVTPETLDRVLSPTVRRVSLRDESGRESDPVLHLVRRGEGFQTLFICNTGHPQGDGGQTREIPVRERRLKFPALEVRWKSLGAGTVTELDLNTGLFHAVESELRHGERIFRTSLPELGSRLFIESAEPPELSPRPAEPSGEPVMELPRAGWRVSRDEPNVLVLDHARYSAGDGRWSRRMFFIDIDAELRRLLGRPPRGGAMVQPYMNADRSPERTLPLTLEYSFECRRVPESDVELALERPDLYELELNGKTLPAEDVGYWIDPSLRRLRVPARMLRNGCNTLVLHCTYHDLLPGVESMFLLGDFGVENEAVTGLPESVAVGDWCAQGFPHYAGNFTYICKVSGIRSDGRPLFLEFGEWQGCALGVRVNGGKTHLVPWAPYRVEIGEELTAGENEIALTVFGHRRNAFGPFFLNETWPQRHGPRQFKSRQSERRNLVPCGMLEPPRLVH